LIGFGLGIAASLVAAVVFYVLVESKSRDLSLYINPTKTTIVRSEQTSDLHVLYKGQSVSSDVTALQMAVWNAGKEPIRSEHILAPIVLSTSPRTPILEARIRHVSRSVVGIQLDTGRLADGILPLSWKILEHNDGATIQLIVAGSDKITASIKGVVEGQRQLAMASPRRVTSFQLVGFVVCGALYGSMVVLTLLRLRKGNNLLRVVNLILSSACFVTVVYLLMSGFFSLVPLPFD